MADGQVPAKGERKDFFLSYTSADRQWAEWIAWQQETAGYSVYLPLWDLRETIQIQVLVRPLLLTQKPNMP